MQQPSLAQDHGIWREIIPNRPDRLNDPKDAVHSELRAVLTNAMVTNVCAPPATGTGRGFCTHRVPNGHNPSGIKQTPDPSRTPTAPYGPLVVRQIRIPPRSVVCTANDAAVSAGAKRDVQAAAINTRDGSPDRKAALQKQCGEDSDPAEGGPASPRKRVSPFTRE